MLAASYPFLDVLWSMFIFFMFFIWIIILFGSSQISSAAATSTVA